MPSYNNLWKILIDRGLKRTDLIFYAGVTSNVVSNMGKNLSVPDSALTKIANFLECDVSDIVSEDSSRRYSGVSKIKENGVVYTPVELSDYVAKRLVVNGSAGNRIRILDPAIGGGELVVSLINEIRLFSDVPIECVGFELDPQVIESTIKRIESVSDEITCEIYNEDFVDAYTSKDLGLFDYIIANPPYIRTQILGADKARKLSKLLNLTGRIDIYYAFMLISSRMLNQNGVAGYITSNKYLSIKAGASLRSRLLNDTSVLEICDFGDTKLFDASVLPCVTFFKNGTTNPDNVTFTSIYETHESSGNVQDGLFNNIDNQCITRFNDKLYSINKGKLKIDNKTGVWSLKTTQSNKFLSTIEDNTFCSLSDIAKIKVGIKTTADPVFIMPSWSGPGPVPELAYPLITHRNAGQIKPGSNQYWIVIYPHQDVNGKTKAVDLIDYPITKEYLENHKQKLSSREYVAKAGRNWYEIWVPQKAHLWSKPKIAFRDISDVPQFWYDDSGAIVNGDCYWIDFKEDNDNLIYLCLAVFNSSLIEKFYDLNFNTKLYSGKRRYMTQYVDQFPIPDPSKPESKALVDLVKHYLVADDDDCSHLKKEIDEMVYASFGLSQKNPEEAGSEFLNSELSPQTAEYGL